MLLALTLCATPWTAAFSAEPTPAGGALRPDIDAEQGRIEAEIKRITEDRRRLEEKEKELHDSIQERTQRLQQQQRTLDEQAQKIQQQQRSFDEQRRHMEELKIKIDDLAQPPVPAGEAPPSDQRQTPAAPPATETAPPAEAVGRAPQPGPARPSQVADLLQQQSILTPPGTLVVEPQLQFSNSSVTHVSLDGYTVLPALVVGSIDIRSIRRNTITAALGMRYGATRNLELETRIPYVRRDDQTTTRPLSQGANQDVTTGISGVGLGDVELAAHYQLDGKDGTPYLVANLRIKSDTGKSPFEIPVDENRLPTSLATGTGFWGVQPSLTFTLPSDPAVFFGNAGYLWNQERTVNSTVGTIAPGNAVNISLGMGLALNENASFSLSYSHNVVQPARQNGQPIKGAQQLQVGTLTIGTSYRVGRLTSLNFSLGIGVTQDAPDIQVSFGMPFNIELHK